MTLLQYKCLKRKCSACCGPVSIPKAIVEKHKALLPVDAHFYDMEDENLVVTKETGPQCGFLNENSHSCLIYEDRPTICRDYGTTDELPCPFLLPNGCKRSRQDARATQKRIDKEVDKTIARFSIRGD